MGQAFRETPLEHVCLMCDELYAQVLECLPFDARVEAAILRRASEVVPYRTYGDPVRDPCLEQWITSGDSDPPALADLLIDGVAISGGVPNGSTPAPAGSTLVHSDSTTSSVGWGSASPDGMVTTSDSASNATPAPGAATSSANQLDPVMAHYMRAVEVAYVKAFGKIARNRLPSDDLRPHPFVLARVDTLGDLAAERRDPSLRAQQEQLLATIILEAQLATSSTAPTVLRDPRQLEMVAGPSLSGEAVRLRKTTDRFHPKIGGPGNANIDLAAGAPLLPVHPARHNHQTVTWSSPTVLAGAAPGRSFGAFAGCLATASQRKQCAEQLGRCVAGTLPRVVQLVLKDVLDLPPSERTLMPTTSLLNYCFAQSTSIERK